MWDIDKNIQYPLHRRGYLKVALKTDKALHPSYFIPPITWTGYVDGKSVKIIQKEQEAISIDDFEFEIFPHDYQDLKYNIIELIDDCMRIMD